MGVRYFYVDESYDRQKFCLTALSIRHSDWRECFERVHQFRKELKAKHGLYIRKEIHASDFVSGRGQVADRVIGKHERAIIFHALLGLVASLPRVWLFNVCLDSPGRRDVELDAWERLLNRIERTTRAMDEREQDIRAKLIATLSEKLGAPLSKDLKVRLISYTPRAMILADEGREREITTIFRKMNVYNPIPSKYGGWGPEKARSKNIPLQRIVEDPVFKNSKASFFIQLVDCCAWALLKRETLPTSNVSKYGFDKAFDSHLKGICYTPASPHDPLGIVRK